MAEKKVTYSNYCQTIVIVKLLLDSTAVLAVSSTVVESKTPIRQRAYLVIYSHWEQVQKEIKGMLKAGVIRSSKSPWDSPIV